MYWQWYKQMVQGVWLKLKINIEVWWSPNANFSSTILPRVAWVVESLITARTQLPYDSFARILYPASLMIRCKFDFLIHNRLIWCMPPTWQEQHIVSSSLNYSCVSCPYHQLATIDRTAFRIDHALLRWWLAILLCLFVFLKANILIAWILSCHHSFVYSCNDAPLEPNMPFCTSLL